MTIRAIQKVVGTCFLGQRARACSKTPWSRDISNVRQPFELSKLRACFVRPKANFKLCWKSYIILARSWQFRRHRNLESLIFSRSLKFRVGNSR
ncbi:hypothetical protein B0H12DRAFT_1104198 [Mycena haematopus]|nr:hypothetical protein B0H12DRAFT_1104198 [Mycena haematopus]